MIVADHLNNINYIKPLFPQNRALVYMSSAEVNIREKMSTFTRLSAHKLDSDRFEEALMDFDRCNGLNSYLIARQAKLGVSCRVRVSAG
jgi:hypothetical protein